MVLRGSAGSRRISLAICDHSQRVIPAATYGTGRAPWRWCIGLHPILYSIIILLQIDDVRCHTQTHYQLKNWHHWLHGPVVRCVSAAEHHSAEQYFKTGGIKRRKHLPRSDLSWNTRLYFPEMPDLWKWRMHLISHLGIKCNSKVIRLVQHRSVNS